MEITKVTIEANETGLTFTKANKQPSKGFVGDFVDENGDHIGRLFKTKDLGVGKGEWRVYKKDTSGYKVIGVSQILQPKDFERCGGMQVSSSQSVRFYRLRK